MKFRPSPRKLFLRSLFSRSVGTIRKELPQSRLGLEALEDRSCPAITVLNTLADGSTGSLPWAVELANFTPGDDTIDFDSSVFGTPQTITLEGNSLVLSDTTGTTTIAGAPGLTVSAGGLSGVFQIEAGAIATISNLTITGG